MTQDANVLTEEERDTILAATKIGAAAHAVVAGVLDGQTASEVDEAIQTITDGLTVLQQRRDALATAGRP